MRSTVVRTGPRGNALLLLVVMAGCNLFNAVPESSNVPDLGADTGPDMADPWWDEAWTLRLPLTLDFAGLAPAERVPVPIALDAAGTALSQAAQGADVRVIGPNGPVPHELARWDFEGALIWALVDVDPSKPLRYDVYLGNPAATSTDAPRVVWDGFYAVLHFENDVTANVVRDWIGAADREPTLVPGVVGDALGTSEGSVVFETGVNPLGELNVAPGTARTISMCFRSAPSSAPQSLIWAEANCIGWFWRLEQGSVRPVLRTGIGCTDYVENSALGEGAYSDAEWHCATTRIDRVAGIIDVTVDGAKLAAATLDVGGSASGFGSLHVGADPRGLERVNGAVDEVWIQRGAPGDSWVRASHAALRPGFVVVGSAEQRP